MVLCFKLGLLLLLLQLLLDCVVAMVGLRLLSLDVLVELFVVFLLLIFVLNWFMNWSIRICVLLCMSCLGLFLNRYWSRGFIPRMVVVVR